MRRERKRPDLVIVISALLISVAPGSTTHGQALLPDPASTKFPGFEPGPALVSGEASIRQFWLDPNARFHFAGDVYPAKANGPEAVAAFLTAAGLDLSKTSETRIFYNDRTGALMVRGSNRDFEMVEAALRTAAYSTPVVSIRAQMVEFPPEALDEEMREALNFHSKETTHSKVLTKAKAASLLEKLERREGVAMLTFPGSATLSGRQARLAIESESYPVTDPPFTAPGKAPKAKWSRSETRQKGPKTP